MQSGHYIIICEGASEYAYLQQAQQLIREIPLKDYAFEPPFKLIPFRQNGANGGHFNSLKKRFAEAKRANRNSPIHIWADFDVYHRNDSRCAQDYANKSQGIPDFHFSLHNFEDFLALHFKKELLAEWIAWGERSHFNNPLATDDGASLIAKLMLGYQKGSLESGFVTIERLKILKENLSLQPNSNPYELNGIGKFADFLIGQLERHHPEIFR
jgi:hypothetical protein